MNNDARTLMYSTFNQDNKLPVAAVKGQGYRISREHDENVYYGMSFIIDVVVNINCT